RAGGTVGWVSRLARCTPDLRGCFLLLARHLRDAGLRRYRAGAGLSHLWRAGGHLRFADARLVDRTDLCCHQPWARQNRGPAGCRKRPGPNTASQIGSVKDHTTLTVIIVLVFAVTAEGRDRALQAASTRTSSVSSSARPFTTGSSWMAAPSRALRATPLTSTEPLAGTRYPWRFLPRGYSALSPAFNVAPRTRASVRIGKASPSLG